MFQKLKKVDRPRRAAASKCSYAEMVEDEEEEQIPEKSKYQMSSGSNYTFNQCRMERVTTYFFVFAEKPECQEVVTETGKRFTSKPPVAKDRRNLEPVPIEIAPTDDGT